MSFTPSFSCVLLFAIVPCAIFGAQKCASVVGKLVCARNEDAVLSAELRMYDRDGPAGNPVFEFFGTFDKDDLMGSV